MKIIFVFLFFILANSKINRSLDDEEPIDEEFNEEEEN
jgi:hypothetical protein